MRSSFGRFLYVKYARISRLSVLGSRAPETKRHALAAHRVVCRSRWLARWRDEELQPWLNQVWILDATSIGIDQTRPLRPCAQPLRRDALQRVAGLHDVVVGSIRGFQGPPLGKAE